MSDQTQVMDQTNVFLASEADAWFERNKDALAGLDAQTDPASLAVRGLMDVVGNDRAQPITVTEIGCATGYRLAWLKQDGARVFGVEPSGAAVRYGQENLGLSVDEIQRLDAASYFKAPKVKSDFIIFGHCLYLVAPEDIPQIVAGAFSALNEGGYIIIYDFDSVPQRQTYHHLEGLNSYKAHFDEFFTWHPMMRLIEKRITNHDRSPSVGNPKEDCALSVIRKVTAAHAYPELIGDIDA